MASISTASALEGVDVAWVTSNAPLSRLDSESERQVLASDATEISTAGLQHSMLATLAEVASSVASTQMWSGTQATSATPDGLAYVSARSAAQTPARDYKVEVLQLATTQITSTATFSTQFTAVRLGTLNIEIGTWNSSQSAFVLNPNWPKASVSIGPQNESLERVRDKINSAGFGVVASVVSDATGSRLILRSTGTGVDRGFRISAEEPSSPQALDLTNQDSVPLSALAFDPGSQGSGGMQLLQSSRNAQVKVNDETIESPLNVIESKGGLSLILKKTTDAPITISVQPDQVGMRQVTQNFIQAYNAAQKLGGSVANTIKQGTLQLLGTTEQPTELGRTLARTGITLTPSGEFQVNDERLVSALQQDSAFLRQSQTMLAEKVLADLPTHQNAFTPDTNALARPNANRIKNASTSTESAMLRQRLLDQYQDTTSRTEIEVSEPTFQPPA